LALLLWMAVLPGSGVRAQPLPAFIDSLGQRLVAGHPGGAVIGIVDDGQRTVAGFGAADTVGTRPTARTLFEIGSITKTFTGLLLAEAIERGAVQLSDPATRYLPDTLNGPMHERGPITLGQLVTHRSGLPRLPANLQPIPDPTDPYAHYTVGDLYAFLDGYRPARPPDSAYAYSNLGMGLLGHVLARRADTSYAALVQQRIATPLGLADTRITLTADPQRRFARGYNPAGAPTPPWHLPTLAGAGALRSTAADMLTYLRAHLAPPDTTRLGRARQRATTPVAPADLGDNAAFAGTRIGYGWHVTPRDGQTITWHNGGTGGFSSFAGFNRATGHGVVVLVSTGGIARTATETGFTLLTRLARADAAESRDR
jgi:CubicO group peptidase (beta-lactamase class C family)